MFSTIIVNLSLSISFCFTYLVVMVFGAFTLRIAAFSSLTDLFIIIFPFLSL